MQTLPSSPQGVSTGSRIQVAEQQSPFWLLPSSHSSGVSGRPLPQNGVRVGVRVGVEVGVRVAVCVGVEVRVGVCVGVDVCVEVWVKVGVGVAVGV